MAAMTLPWQFVTLSTEGQANECLAETLQNFSLKISKIFSACISSKIGTKQYGEL